MRLTIFIFTQLLLSSLAYAQFGFPLRYEENVNVLKENSQYDDFLMTINDTINNEIVSYNCPDTLFCDSCKPFRLIRIGENDNIVLDSSISQISSSRQVPIKMKEYVYGENYTVIRQTKGTSINSDSLIFNANKYSVELFVNNKIDKQWSYDSLGRVIQIKYGLKNPYRKSVKDYTYYKDSIIITDSTSFLGYDDILRLTFVYDSDLKLIERWVEEKKIRYKTHGMEIDKDSITWSKIDSIPRKIFYKYFGEDSVEITHNYRVDTNVFTLNNGEISTYTNYHGTFDENAVLYIFSSTERSLVVDQYSGKDHISSTITKFDVKGNKKELTHSLFRKAYVDKESESYNEFGFPIKTYRVKGNDIYYSKICIEK